VSDVAAALRAFTGDLSALTVLTFALIAGTSYLLWRTPFGLRLRSAGEHPSAAESLGVDVYRMKYLGVMVSGAMAGLGGAFLVLEQAGIYREGQTGGRGFIGLAAMIFGNWNPVGAGAAARPVGVANALELRSGEAVHALLLFVAIAAALLALLSLRGRRMVRASVLGGVAVGFAVWFAVSDEVPRQFISFTPHLATLLVLAFAAQQLRPPSKVGLVYRRGQVT
jgi:simple sugar transport system permease protein